MEQHAFKNVNNCLNTNHRHLSNRLSVKYIQKPKTAQTYLDVYDTNIYSYLETSAGQSSNLYLNVVHFFNASVN